MEDEDSPYKREPIYNIQNENLNDEELFLLEKIEEEDEKDAGTPKFGDFNKFEQFKFIYRNEEKRIKFINDLSFGMKIWHHIHSSKNFKIKLSK